MANPSRIQRPASSPLAALLAWLVPGLGHWWIGESTRAVIFFVFICVTFWGGVAVGGVRATVNPRDNGLWIAAQFCAGPQGVVALLVSNYLGKLPEDQQFKASWPSADIGVIYSGVAGLLNLLVIIDVLARIDVRQIAMAARPPPDKTR